jgi:uncharacterized protein (TIGR00661 family)
MKRVLYTVLDWGLGHATRSVPIIQELQNQNFQVMIAGSGASLQLLKSEFPHLRAYELPGYDPRYSKKNSMVRAMLSQLPKFYKVIKQEHLLTEKLVREEQAHVVISDNRYGCWSKAVPSILVTHQSNIQMPQRFGWLAPMVRAITKRLFTNFTECWVPDFENGMISGDLSDFSKLKAIEVNFIGPISRFNKRSTTKNYRYDVLAIFSGPEPQRTVFEEIVLTQLKNSNHSFFAVRGLPVGGHTNHEENMINFADAALLHELIESSEIIVARSGYSTVMDLMSLGKKAILVPTPGQTEQEYLATVLHKKAWFYSTSQQDFKLNMGLASVHDCKLPFDFDWSENYNLRAAISKLHARLNN